MVNPLVFKSMTTASKPNTIKSINPATNELLMEVDITSPAQLEAITSHADTAFQAWKATSFAQRATILNRAADLMDERQEELGRLATLEMGKKLAESIFEVTFSANFFRYYAQHGAAFLADKKVETPWGTPGFHTSPSARCSAFIPGISPITKSFGWLRRS